MNNLAKITEKPIGKAIKKHQEKRNYKKFQEEKKRIEKDVNFWINLHNSDWCKRDIGQEDIDHHINTREYAVKKGKEIRKLAQEYGIQRYKIYFTDLQ